MLSRLPESPKEFSAERKFRTDLKLVLDSILFLKINDYAISDMAISYIHRKNQEAGKSAPVAWVRKLKGR
ncbi:MAG: hypothetical protein C4530_01115 [Desulfobacteraceae bacterium]|nr:MAG: hypothetical protein C4530_01115 [Desulfobacteraceae bacterium]